MLLARMCWIPIWFGIIGTFVISLFIPLLVGMLARRIGAYDIMFKPYYFIEKKRGKRI